MKITITQKQWEEIGNNAGWIKGMKMSNKYDVYKSIRKPMPPPSRAIEDDMGYERKPNTSISPIDQDRLSLPELEEEANALCTIKGHQLSKWKPHNRNVSTNTCLICNKQVIVNSNPKPNEPDISGTAIKEDCI